MTLGLFLSPVGLRPAKHLQALSCRSWFSGPGGGDPGGRGPGQASCPPLSPIPDPPHSPRIFDPDLGSISFGEKRGGCIECLFRDIMSLHGWVFKKCMCLELTSSLGQLGRQQPEGSLDRSWGRTGRPEDQGGRS